MALCEVTELSQQYPSIPGFPLQFQGAAEQSPASLSPLPDKGFQCWSTQPALSSQPTAITFSPTQGKVFI